MWLCYCLALYLCLYKHSSHTGWTLFICRTRNMQAVHAFYSYRETDVLLRQGMQVRAGNKERQMIVQVDNKGKREACIESIDKEPAMLLSSKWVKISSTDPTFISY